MVPNDFEPRHGALYATAAPNNTESRWATCPDVTMVNGYGEDNVLPHGRQFAIPWFLTSHPTIGVSFFLNLATSRIMKLVGLARRMRGGKLYCELIFFFSISFDGMRSTWLTIQMSLAGLD